MTALPSRLYDQLSDEDKADATKIEAALRTAFATDKFSAYDEFRNRKWKSGETVDVFLAKLNDLLVWLTLAARRMKKSQN